MRHSSCFDELSLIMVTQSTNNVELIRLLCFNMFQNNLYHLFQ